MTIVFPALQERARQSLAARLLHARTTRDFAAVEHFSLELLRKHPQHAGIRRALARTLAALGRSEDARPHWQNLLCLNPRDIEAAHHLSPRRSAARVPDDDFRHIAICGVSFCGSTLMDRVLGSLPGSANIAESHWLTGARLADGYAPIDFDAPDAGALHHCNACGSDCPVLSMDFRRGLAADATDWYGRIARRLDTQTLISADKNPPKLVDHDPLMRFDALVLFKSPLQAWMSARRKLPAGMDHAFYARECTLYLALWAGRYATFLDHFRPQGRLVFLHFDDFAQSPGRGLRALCRALGLVFDERALGCRAERHPIGGNARYLESGESGITALAPPDCPDEDLRLIANAAQAQTVYRHLLKQSEISLSR